MIATVVMQTLKILRKCFNFMQLIVTSWDDLSTVCVCACVCGCVCVCVCVCARLYILHLHTHDTAYRLLNNVILFIFQTPSKSFDCFSSVCDEKKLTFLKRVKPRKRTSVVRWIKPSTGTCVCCRNNTETKEANNNQREIVEIVERYLFRSEASSIW